MFDLPLGGDATCLARAGQGGDWCWTVLSPNGDLLTMTRSLTAPDYMLLALEEAEAAERRDEVPVGAVLVDAASGDILARDGNRTRGNADPTAHAEILVIRAVAAARGVPRLPDCDLYVTLEPCALCAAAISFARLRRVVFGAHDEKMGAVVNGPKFFEQKTCHHRPEVEGGVLVNRSADLLRGFFKARRSRP
jgi:tRNA(Arg) A34 adenosine deaminase TadA